MNDEWSQLVVHLYSPLNLFCEYSLFIPILIFWSYKVPCHCLKGICYYGEQHQLDNDHCNFWINCHMFSMKNMISTHKMIFYEKTWPQSTWFWRKNHQINTTYPSMYNQNINEFLKSFYFCIWSIAKIC